jgi:hypothetical protein
LLASYIDIEVMASLSLWAAILLLIQLIVAIASLIFIWESRLVKKAHGDFFNKSGFLSF